MEVMKIIERAEKQTSLGRFDKKSAISYINDALYKIVSRNSLKLKESRYVFLHEKITLNGIVIKVNSVEFEDDRLNSMFGFRVNPDGTISTMKKVKGKLEPLDYNDPIVEEKFNIVYIGYIPVKEEDDKINMPDQYESSIVNYLKHKIFEEQDEFDKSQFFEQQFRKELIDVAHSKQSVIVKPSKYSLL